MAAMGLGVPVLGTFLGCSEDLFSELVETDFNGKVLVVGAGAAGLTAGYALARHGIDFEILEASDVIGGRMKRSRALADFPIDLGAEWIHTDPTILTRLVNDQTFDASVEVIRYSPETISIWNGSRLKGRNWINAFYAEYKFKSTTWYGFFERFMLPAIGDRIRFAQVVQSVDYAGDKVVVRTAAGQEYTGDKVVMTVPIAVLKAGAIDFTPPLPADRVEAFEDVDVPPILKAFIEFSEDFYPDLTIDGSITDTDKLFYDAAFRKDTDRNVLGLFVIGDKATAYTELATEEQVVSRVLGELDTIFGDRATPAYLGSVVQDWTKEPHIMGSYSHWERESSRELLAQPLGANLFFAGEALAEEWSTVHGASLSGWDAVRALLSA